MSAPLISFIVPAHNEELVLGATLAAIHDSGRATGLPYEIIVVDDASTDRTAKTARQHSAVVVPVNHRQIAATRNSGGRAARGERLFFVDADTTINALAVAEALRHLDRGAVGGGGPALFDDPVPLELRLIGRISIVAYKLAGFTGGAFMYCTRAAFLAGGGFNEKFYWAEEGSFALRLKKQGRFVTLWHPVRTSSRRFRSLTLWQLLPLLAPILFAPVRAFTSRSSVRKIWYDSNRSMDGQFQRSPLAKVNDAVSLIIVLALLSGPFWDFIPWSWTPKGTILGWTRLVIGIFDCHAGLICIPLALILAANLFQRLHWFEWLKLAALTAFCFWAAWQSANGVIWAWTTLAHWLARRLHA